ncbi:hypothetical protein [Leeuwenhoekiella marinoflava]|uniref:Uncharacterized protein n=2 Tax=Leeuwenhoekiella marinoflava TaxID=988 RepID=A0A4Q0P6P0_9FLAO|nr:hypothetical protein [Leeuwenhoekiella marinoflava]RXG21898.1 hypothetical protein DSL99_4009 [Leeuwenhoekiella marinoflava]SHG01885.1 hypothetical protein SAMN02745246_03997 [Leeuwenhoekiella marinoflava DSM 3653]
MYQQQKKVTAEGTKGSKSKTSIMKSVQNIQKEAESKQTKTKKENAQDKISKSICQNINANCLNSLGSILINL